MQNAERQNRERHGENDSNDGDDDGKKTSECVNVVRCGSGIASKKVIE